MGYGEKVLGSRIFDFNVLRSLFFCASAPSRVKIKILVPRTSLYFHSRPLISTILNVKVVVEGCKVWYHFKCGSLCTQNGRRCPCPEVRHFCRAKHRPSFSKLSRIFQCDHEPNLKPRIKSQNHQLPCHYSIPMAFVTRSWYPDYLSDSNLWQWGCGTSRLDSQAGVISMASCQPFRLFTAPNFSAL